MGDIALTIAMISTFLAFAVTFIGFISDELAGKRIAVATPAWAFATSTVILMFAVWNVEIALRLVEPVGTSMAMGFLMLHSLPLVGLPFLIMAGLTLVLRLVEPVGTSMAMGFLMLHSLPLVGLPFLIMAGLTLVSRLLTKRFEVGLPPPSYVEHVQG
jgi:hypothetical protein